MSIAQGVVSFLAGGTCVIDANQAGNANYTAAPQAQQFFPVGSAPAITSGTSTSFAAGAAGSFTVTSSGSPAPALSVSGTLPAGVTFTDNGDGTATLSGTPGPGSGGSYPVTITASNGVGKHQAFVLTVTAAPAITSASSTAFTIGQPAGFTVTTTGYPAPSLSDTGALPAGVSFTDNQNGTATITGTPSRASIGVFPITVIASDGTASVTQAFTLTVQSGAIVITSAASTTMTAGAAASFTARRPQPGPDAHTPGNAARRHHVHRPGGRHRDPVRHPGGRRPRSL